MKFEVSPEGNTAIKNKCTRHIRCLLTGLLVILSNTFLFAQSVAKIDRLRSRAELLYSQGDYPKALVYYLDGYRLACRVDPARAANLAVDISAIHHIQGNYQLGAQVCQEGLKLIQKATIPSDSVRFKLYSSLGEMYKKLNKQDSCYLYFSLANKLLREHTELENRVSDYVIYHYNNQGMMYVRAGGYTEGLGYLNKALLVAERHTASLADMAILYNNIGGLHEKLGDFKKALELRELAARSYRKNDIYKYLIYSGSSWDAMQLGRYSESRFYAQKALELARIIANENSPEQNLVTRTLALSYLGECYFAMGLYQQAHDAFSQVVEQYTTHRRYKGNTIAKSLLGLARIHQKKGETEQALTYCQRAIVASHLSFQERNLAKNPAPDGAIADQALFAALALKAELLSNQFQAKKDPQALHLSLITYRHALAVADLMRRSYNALDSKWFFTAKVRPVYLQAFETAFALQTYAGDQRNFQQVFAMAEQSKASVLADLTRELLIKPANVPAELVSQERELQRKLTQLKLDPNRVDTTFSELVDTQIKLAQLQQRFEKEFATYYRAKYQPQTVQFADLQANLDDQTAYLNYMIVGDKIYIIALTKRGHTVVQKTDDQRQLRSAVEMLRKALYKNPGLGNYTGTRAAITCYRWLIEPVAAQLPGIKRLIVVRDGELHHLPFEVFESGQVVNDFLIKKYAVNYVPSALSMLHAPLTTKTEGAKSLLSLAPFAKPVEATSNALPLVYLPGSQLEVESLPGDQLIGSVATKHRFLRNYGQYEMLHLATHAHAVDNEPARSYIAFYPDGNPDKLYSEEIYNLSLPNTQLVVLSACETGAGQLHTGEGFMSLAQAFAYAGCPAVISTLWSANDESTAFLSQKLYQHLQDGLPIDIALQRTRLDYFHSDQYRKFDHPYYWANLVLTGNRQAVYTPNALSTTKLYGIALTVALIGGIGFFSKYIKLRLTR